MKAEKQLNQDFETVSRFFQKLADDDAKQPARTGLKYAKKISGMNGKTQKMEIEILKLEPGAYSVSFTRDGLVIQTDYTYAKQDDGSVLLTYTEKSHDDKVIGGLNQKISTFLFSRTAKKQMNRRLDAFAKSLEEFACQD